MRRLARYAGSWYPGRLETLRLEVDEYIAAGGPPSDAVGLIAPHAGYRYSGPIAGRGYAAVNVPDSAIVLAPSHHRGASAVAVWDGDAWETPLGDVAIDVELREALLGEYPEAARDCVSHQAEHSLELQLPFLRTRNPGVKIVPVLVATHDGVVLESFGRACAAAIASTGRQRTLLVASSDMTHYESAADARRKDAPALERVQAVDGAGLMEVVDRDDISMCGAAPTAVMLFAARQMGPVRGEVVAYGTSGDVTGDETQVVAYAAAVVRAAGA